LQVRRISSSLSAVRMIEPSHPDAHLSTVPSVRMTCLPSGPPRQISIIRPDEVFIPSGPHTVSKSFYASLLPSVRFSSTSGRLSVLDQFLISFQVPRKGRSINRPEDVVSRPDACLLKARIAVQISPSGRVCIKEGNCRFDFNRPDDCLSWSGRTHCRYGNCVLKNSRLDAHPPWSGYSKAL
jgi:hypothetical protein